MEKSKIRVHFPSRLECTSAVQPVIRRLCLGNSFTCPALDPCPPVSLLQTTCLGFLTLVLLPCFSASPITWLFPQPLNVQEFSLWADQTGAEYEVIVSFNVKPDLFVHKHRLESKQRFLRGREACCHIVPLSFQAVSRAVNVVRQDTGLLQQAQIGEYLLALHTAAASTSWAVRWCYFQSSFGQFTLPCMDTPQLQILECRSGLGMVGGIQ